MFKKFISIITLIMLLNGCSHADYMSSSTYDPETGKFIEKIYTGDYGGREMIVPDIIGIHLVIDTHKDNRRLFAINDESELGVGSLVTMYLHNLTNKDQKLKINQAKDGTGMYLTKAKMEVEIPADSIKKFEIGRTEGVREYGTSTYMIFKYEYLGKEYVRDIKLKRSTVEELKEYNKRWKDKKLNVKEFFEN